MKQPTPASDLERRKQVKVRMRGDLAIAPQKYEGRTYYVVKDPVGLRYYRFKEHEHFVIKLMDGSTSLDEAQKEFEKQYRPERMKLEDLEAFAQQLINAGLAQNESPQAGKLLFDQRRKRRRNEWLQTLTNILYIKIPLFDPDKILTRMVPYTWWIFTMPFLLLSIGVMLAAILLVATHFDAFLDKLPYSGNFFTLRNFASFAAQNLAYMWVGLAVVKVIHEFGHGLSCKTFGGEVHEMGLLFLVLSPAMYCNVSDAWTLPNKWKRIIISAAGIYVELIIAAIATFVWWNTPSHPLFFGVDINNLSLSLMVLCSISTVLFNANPLMRYDGYYVLADWLEIPNLRDRSNRFLKNVMLEYCLGVEVQPEPYMELSRKVLFVAYAIISYVYRIWVTYYIILFLYSFLEPYRLQVVSEMLAWAAAGSLIGWPLFRLGKNLHKRGRLPDMKPLRVTISSSVVAALLLFVFLVPLPVSRVIQTGAVELLPDPDQPDDAAKIFVPVPGILEGLGPRARDGQHVEVGEVLAQFYSHDLEDQLDKQRSQAKQSDIAIASAQAQLTDSLDPADREKIQAELATAIGDRENSNHQADILEQTIGRLTLRAPRAGVIMSPPRPEEIGKLWEKEQNVPFCTIGDPERLRVVVPVSPSEYRLLKRDREKLLKDGKDLEVTIRVHGRENSTWKGKVVRLPESAAKYIPAALSNKCGGPVATKPSSRPDVFEPLSQQYLVYVEIQNPDSAICPGTLAQAKIHCKYRTCAWWAWHSLSEAFNLGYDLDPFHQSD
jgi:putative peptide zinc metalloprotease protein